MSAPHVQRNQSVQQGYWNGFIRPSKWEQKPLKPVDQNIMATSKTKIKEHKAGQPLPQRIRDSAQEAQIRSDRNIFHDILKAKHLKSTAHDIEVSVRHCVRRVEDKKNPITADEASEMRKFFEKISALDVKTFDRNKLLGGQMKLQRLLSRELDQLLRVEEQNTDLQSNPTHLLNVAVAKARLAIDLGHGMVSANKGQNGTMLVKSLENQYIGVFKAPAKFEKTDFKTMFKNCVGQARLLNRDDELGQQFAEVAAHKFGNAMGFKDLAPEATMAKINGKYGAFIAFLPGYKELKSLEADIQKRKKFDEHEKKVWQMICAFKFVVGDMDPHNENIFVKTDDAGKLSEIRVIDHGNSFIEKNPGKYGLKGNQGDWGRYNISKEKFVPEVLEFIENQLNVNNFDKFLKDIGSKHQKFMTQRMYHNQMMRLNVLKQCVATGKIKTPEELSRIHTDKDFQKLLKDVHVSSKPAQCFNDFVVVDITG